MFPQVPHDPADPHLDEEPSLYQQQPPASDFSGNSAPLGTGQTPDAHLNFLVSYTDPQS